MKTLTADQANKIQMMKVSFLLEANQFAKKRNPFQ